MIGQIGPAATDHDPVLGAFIAHAGERHDPILDRTLDDWVRDPQMPMLLAGASGSGCAEALCRLGSRRIAAGDAVVLRHAGLMPPDPQAPSLLWDLLVQLRRIAALPQWPPPLETDMRETLPNWLARACARGPLWLLVADIDVAGDADGVLAWLPDYWPPNLRVAASAGSAACAQRLADAGWRVYDVGGTPDLAVPPMLALRNNPSMIIPGAAPAAPVREPGIPSVGLARQKPDYGPRALRGPVRNDEALPGCVLSRGMPAAAAADPDALATIAALLALARTPLDAAALAAISGVPSAQVQAATGALQPVLLRIEPGQWAPAGAAARGSLLARYLPDEYRRPRFFELLATRCDPLTAAAYFRDAGRRDQGWEALLQRGAIAATALPEARMRWLAEWRALNAGSLAEALLPVLLVADQALLLAGSELVDAAGEEIPADWLERAAAGRLRDLSARARLWQSRGAARSGDWATALRRAREALELAQDVSIQGNARHELARASEGSGDLTQAVALYGQALAEQESRYGDDSERLLPALGNLVGVLRADNQLARARQLAERALRIAARCGPADPAEAAACDQLAAIAYAGADFAAAEAAYRDTLRIVEAAFGPSHPATAAALHNLGTALDARRGFAEAEQCYRRALAIREARHGRASEEAATTLHNLAAVLETIGKSGEAERLYREATDIWEELYGAEHPATMSSLTNLAGVLGSRGAYADAEVCYRAAAEGWRRLVGEDHPNTLGALAELGRMYADAGKPELGVPLLEHVVETGRRALGDTDAHYVNSVCALAALWRDQRRFDEARALLNATLMSVERRFGLLAPAAQQLRRQLDTLDEAVVH